MKRAIVEYDELGNPVKLTDVREFRDDSVEAFKALCAGNAKKRDERLRQAEQKAIQKENEAKTPPQCAIRLDFTFVARERFGERNGEHDGRAIRGI